METHSADAADPKAAAAEVSRAPPEPSPAPAVTPVTPVNPERGSERDRVESAMREILEEGDDMCLKWLKNGTFVWKQRGYPQFQGGAASSGVV